jgi:hypothetical protein
MTNQRMQLWRTLIIAFYLNMASDVQLDEDLNHIRPMKDLNIPHEVVGQ